MWFGLTVLLTIAYCSVAASQTALPTPCEFPTAIAGLTSMRYSRCVAVESFNLYWTVDSDAQTIAIAVRHSNTAADQWLGVGFSPNSAEPMMKGSKAVIGTAFERAATPASLNEKSPSGVVADPTWTIINGSAETGTDNFDTLSFTRPLRFPTSDGPVSLAVDGSVLAGIVLATGTGSLRDGSGLSYHHTDRARASIDFGTGSSVAVPIDEMTGWKAAHGLLMALSWGVVIPAGVFAARFGKMYTLRWFDLHRALQLIGVAMFTIGFGIGEWKIGTGSYPLHSTLGFFVALFGWCNPLIAMCRKCRFCQPKPSADSDDVSFGPGAAKVVPAAIQSTYEKPFARKVVIGLIILTGLPAYVALYLIWMALVLAAFIVMERFRRAGGAALDSLAQLSNLQSQAQPPLQPDGTTADVQ